MLASDLQNRGPAAQVLLAVAVTLFIPGEGIADGIRFHAGGGGHHHGGHAHHHHGHHHHGHHHHFGLGFGFGHHYYGGGFHSGIPYSPGAFYYGAPGYSFYHGTQVYTPGVSVWSFPYGGGYYYQPPTYYVAPYGLAPAAPEVLQPIPADEEFDEWLDENRRLWGAPSEEPPIEQRPQRFVRPSTPAAQLRSIRREHEGDLQLQNLQYAVAAQRYEEAIAAAPDRPAPYFRLAVAEAGRSRFEDAVLKFKQGLQLDASWPQSADQLDELLGEDNLLGKTLLKQRVADWVREDVRDPDRLFLLAVLLHMDGDERAYTLLESAALLDGMEFHLAAFLEPRDVARAQAVEEENVPAVPEAAAGRDEAGPQLRSAPEPPPPPAP